MKVELLAVTPDPEKLIETAGRTCYLSTSRKKNPAKFVKNRIKEGHESILEHASATIKISGISRACSHQLVRHRIASYSQQSQRYVDETNYRYVVPPDIEDNEEALEVFEDCVEHCRQTYAKLRELGIKKEDARFVLPNATATTIVVTMNFRSWRHFIQLRLLEPGAQWEIKQVAKAVLYCLSGVAPAVFQDLKDEYEQSRL